MNTYQNTDDITPQKPLFFICENCSFKCCNKKDFSRHVLTDKHKKRSNTDYWVKKSFYICNCEKSYKHSQSLYNHKKKCKFIQETSQDKEFIQEPSQENYKEKKEKKEKEEIKNLVITLINENKEFKELLVTQQKQLTEIIPKIGNITNGSNNNSNNNTNNHFNLNFFLNEQCKDALTMNQFIDRVHVTLQNLMMTNDNGLGPGLIKLINDNMNKLTIYERPIHCTDKKRETIYIKNEDAWEKDIDKEGIYNMIKKVEKKQIDNLDLWTSAHPDYESNEDLMSEYMHLINKCTSSIEACRDKVVRNMCGEFFVKE